MEGNITSKVAILDGEETMISWTAGNAMDWFGAWDEYYFTKGTRTDLEWRNRQ